MIFNNLIVRCSLTSGILKWTSTFLCMLVLMINESMHVIHILHLLLVNNGVPLHELHQIAAMYTNDRALFARFARSNLKFQEPGNGDTKLSGKGRGEDTCYMSHVILDRLETWFLASLCLEVHNNCSCVVVSMFQSFIHLNSTAFVWFLLFMM